MCSVVCAFCMYFLFVCCCFLVRLHMYVLKCFSSRFASPPPPPPLFLVLLFFVCVCVCGFYWVNYHVICLYQCLKKSDEALFSWWLCFFPCFFCHILSICILFFFFFFFFFFKESNLLQVRDAQGVPLVIAGWQRLVFGLSNLSEDHKAPKVRTGTFLSKQDTTGHIFFGRIAFTEWQTGIDGCFTWISQGQQPLFIAYVDQTQLVPV